MALVAPAQAVEFIKSTDKTPAQGSLSLEIGPSVFAELKRQGLSFYSIGGPSVGLGDNGGLGMDFNVRAVDGTGRTFTDNDGSSVVWWNGPGNRFLYVGSPTLIRDGRNGTITARVFANNPGDGIGDWGRITLFDVEGLHSTKPDGEPNGYQGRLTLHDGVDVLLNRALFNRDFDAGSFTPGMRLGAHLHGCCATGLRSRRNGEALLGAPRRHKKSEAPASAGGGFVRGWGKGSALRVVFRRR